MQNPTQKFRKSSIGFEKPSTLPIKLKTLISSDYHRVEYFLLKYCTRLLLTNIHKRVFYKRVWEILRVTDTDNCLKRLNMFLTKRLRKINMALGVPFRILTLTCVLSIQPVNV